MAAILSLATLLLASSAFATPSPQITAAPMVKKDMVYARQAAGSATTALPLTDYQFTYPNVPYKVNPFASGRGPQSGYNICNSTTEGPNSLCQTAFVNSIDDFCVWGSPTSNGQIGNVEAQVVAYCTKPGHGTRVMPAGTLTNVQFMRTKGYIQVSGKFNQAGIGLDPTDFGGELDPHGADLAGNPLGGLIFSNTLPTKNGSITQGNNWSNFVGSGLFCMKVCDNSITSPDYCENRFDLVGCAYNMPSDSYNTDGTFTDCQGDVQMPPGQYVSNGQTITWQQPASLTPGYSMPWQPSVPASSSCTTYQSAQLYAQQSGGVSGASSATTTGTGAAATGKTSASGSRTASGSAASSTSSSAASAHGVRAGLVVAGVGAVAALLA